MSKDEKPKLRTVATKRSATCENKFGWVGEYAVHYVKSHEAPENAQFVVAKVATTNGKVIWNFKDEDEYPKNLAYFLEVEGGACCICIVSKKKRDLKKVISLNALHAKIELEGESKRLKALAKAKLKNLLK